MSTREIVNFGGNVRFTPAEYHEPHTEAEVLAILDRHRKGRVRVVASRHAWSPAIETAGALVSMEHFDHVRIEERDGETYAVVGAGCRVKHLLAQLEARGYTTPSVGLITEQTIAGATATGTHGSGKHSLSHYLAAVRIACYRGGEPTIVDVTEGDELRAARCSLGCLGVVLEVTLPLVPQYHVLEWFHPCPSIDEALEREAEWPLQQFYLFPHSWRFFTQSRRVDPANRRGWSAPLYRLWWYLTTDVGLHVLLKTSAAWLRSRWLVQRVFRWTGPFLVGSYWRVTDRSDRHLVMEHELFKHLELEAFVRDRDVAEAGLFVAEVLKQADGTPATLRPEWQDQLASAGLFERFEALRGTFTHHYPVCFRKVLRDDTLISMAAGDAEAWYAISFITYVEPRDPFYALATFLAKSIRVLFDGRIHWGKWFAFDAEEVAAAHPQLPRFREIAREFDPRGVFRNAFTERALGLPNRVETPLPERQAEFSE